MNRRLPIFFAVFVIVCAAGLGYTYSIAPTYVASARIQVDPGTNPDRPHDGAAFVANEAQALTSNEMLESVRAAVSKDPAFWRLGSVPRLLEVLSADILPGTNVIELQARGGEREQLSGLLEVWAAAYLASRGSRRTVDRELTIAEARKAVASVDSRVTRKRRELDEFRSRNNIVSPEREENEVAAQMRSLTSALNEARNKATAAESRLSTVKAGLAEGRPVYRAQDQGIIAQLEQRSLELRQKLKDMEVNFTPQYLAMEPRVKAMHANLRQIEQQIEDTRRSSQQAMLNEATQDVLTAQKNVARLQAQFGERRNDALKFTSRFTEHKAQTAELAQLEAQLAQAQQQVALLERSERAREPKYELLGRPAVPEKPVHPDYAMYFGYALAGALVAALLTVMLVEFLDPRPKPEPAFPQPIIQIAYPALPGGPTPRLPGTHAALPPAPHALPPPYESALRELSVEEVHAIWNAATRRARLAVAALFCGLTLDELANLKWGEVDVEARRIQLPGPRLHLITAPLIQELQDRAPGQAATDAVAAASAGGALSVHDLAGLVAAAAHDAGVAPAETIDADTLRHTYVSFLVRQGVRLSDLEHLVGPLPPASFLHYRTLSPGAGSVSLTAVDRVFPTFKYA